MKKKVIIIGCGAYMDSGYGCPGEWRCLKAANLGEGQYVGEHETIGFIKCECPGRAVVPTIGMTMKLSEQKADVIHFSSCLVNAKPGCPYYKADELKQVIENKFNIPVVLGTHDYH